MFIIFVFNICIYMVLQDIDRKTKNGMQKIQRLDNRSTTHAQLK
jgi:hypothetical protein